MEYAMIDGTIVSVHQKATGAKGALTTKIMALVDALGNLVCFVLMPGQRNDIMGVRPLIDGVSFDALLADKAAHPLLLTRQPDRVKSLTWNIA